MSQTLVRAPVVSKAPPASPYVGLVPFREEDADFFFGREAEKEIVTGNLRSARLTILYGTSGVGKTSLLRAGVVHDLREQILERAAGRPERPPLAVCVFRAWRDRPLAGLVQAIGESVAEALGGDGVETADAELPFVEALRAWTSRVRTLLVVLDQFEDYFLYHPDEDGEGTFAVEFPRALNDANLRVNFLVSIREDSWAKLDRFEGRIPRLFANYIRVEALSREAGRRAIEEPIAAWNAHLPISEAPYRVEPALAEAVLGAAAGGRLVLAEVGDGDGAGIEPVSLDTVEPPFLQLVMEKLWAATTAAGEHELGLARLEALGGAERIVEGHLRDSLAVLDAREQAVASDVFRFLVTRSGTRIAHSASDLAEWTKRSEDEVAAVLDTLCTPEGGRILRQVVPPVGADEDHRYELYHDVLAGAVVAWRRDFEAHVAFEVERAAARRRQRRLAVIAGAALIALAIVAALAVLALRERASAQAHERDARARALEATALQHLTIDPHKSVVIALAGANLKSVPVAENVLRQALIADRLRLVRHTSGEVRAVAVSPDGSLVAASVAPNHVLVLGARNRRLVHDYVVRGPVAELGFVDAGRTLVTASTAGFAHLWDVATGRQVTPSRRLAAARGPDGSLQLVPIGGPLGAVMAHVRRLSAGPGGRVAAVVKLGQSPAQAWLFAPDGSLIRVLPPGAVKDVAFSPDGQLVATATARGVTEVWDTASGRLVRVVIDSKGATNTLAFSPDSRLLATGANDGAVRIWTVASGQRTFFLFAHTNPVTALAWSPDGHVLASAGLDGTVRLWRVQGLVGVGSLAATLSGNGGPILALAFLGGGTRLVTGGADGTVRIWDAQPDPELVLFGRGPGSALAARWVNGMIVGLWSAGVVKTYQAATFRRTHTLRGDQGQSFTSLGVSKNGSVIAAGGADGRTDVWDGRSGERLPTSAGSAGIVAVAVAPSGDLVASGDGSGVVRVWNARSGRVLWTARQVGRVADVEFSPHGDAVVTAGPQGAVIWSASTGDRLHVLPSPLGDVKAVFSPDGRLVATAGSDSNGRLWFAASGSIYRVLRSHKAALTDIAFSRDGRLLATASVDHDARIWIVDTGVHWVLQRSVFGTLSSIGFDSSGRWVAASGPISVVVWSAVSGRQLFYLRGGKQVLTGATFAPGVPSIVSSSHDGTLRRFRCTVCVNLRELERLAHDRLKRAG